MLTETHAGVIDRPSSQAGDYLRIFIIYDDVADAKKAEETCGVLANALGPNWEIDVQMSSFGALVTGRIEKVAATAAMDSHIVMVSCGSSDTAPHVFDWIESSLPVPGRPMALVLLAGVPDPAKRPHPWEQHLEAFAQQRGMHFFHSLYQRTEADETELSIFERQKETSAAN
jgi:hypothetical protein